MEVEPLFVWLLCFFHLFLKIDLVSVLTQSLAVQAGMPLNSSSSCLSLSSARPTGLGVFVPPYKAQPVVFWDFGGENHLLVPPQS